MRKTKIICTIGPASENPEILSQIIEAGMNVSRHNFSHGDHEEHAARINLVKELAKKYNKEIAVMLDTKGPEIRTALNKAGRDVNLNLRKLNYKQGLNSLYMQVETWLVTLKSVQ